LAGESRGVEGYVVRGREKGERERERERETETEEERERLENPPGK